MLIDWRKRVPELVEQQRARKRQRNRMEIIMASATVLSALATLLTVFVAYFQYQAAHDALVAADRNRAIQDLVDATTAMCDVVNGHVVGIQMSQRYLDRFDKEAKVHPHSLIVSAIADAYPLRAPILSDALKPLRRDYVIKSRRYRIWAPAEASDGLGELDQLTGVFIEIEAEGRPTEAQKESVDVPFVLHWAENLLFARQSCEHLPDKIISWYRDKTSLSF